MYKINAPKKLKEQKMVAKDCKLLILKIINFLKCNLY